MQLKAGTRLRSQVCDTEVVVVRKPDADVSIGCGGADMIPIDDDPDTSLTLDPSCADGTATGKRYGDEELGLELLCTKAGAGSLTVNGEPLLIKGAKPLPSSD